MRVTLLHRFGQLPGLVAFLAPLALLVIVWAGIVAVLNVDTRVFPGVGDVFGAAVDSIRDGSLARHVGQSLLRVVVGTSSRDRRRHPARRGHEREPRRGVPPGPALPLLLGARGDRVDPHRDRSAKLPFEHTPPAPGQSRGR